MTALSWEMAELLVRASRQLNKVRPAEFTALANLELYHAHNTHVIYIL